MKLVTRRDAGEVILLAPVGCCVPKAMQGRTPDKYRYDQLLTAVQRMRGTIYLEDGAVKPSQMTDEGRHALPIDERAWHIVALNKPGDVVGCVRYLSHANTISFAKLSIVASGLAKSEEWGDRLRAAVESEIDLARKLQIAYVEVGGWAVSPNLRNTGEALRIALAAYGLARILGGCIGIGTATQRHLSSSILRRIGGTALAPLGVEMPPYFDTTYGCHMEIVRFVSSDPNPRFEPWIAELQGYLLTTEVVYDDVTSSLRNLQDVLRDPEKEHEARSDRQSDFAVYNS